MAAMDSMPMGGAQAPEMGGGKEATAKALVEKLYSPEGQTLLAPLKAALSESGSTMNPADFFILAQKDSRTRGKSPAELAKMLSEDAALAEDVEAIASGKADKMKADMGIKPPSEKGDLPPALPGEMDESKMNFDQKAASMEKKAKAAMPPEGMM
jgi:hypothetical protein